MGTPGQKTRELVALAKDGDESALGQLCRVYGPRVRWIVRLRMGKELRSKLDSMDLVEIAIALEDYTASSSRTRMPSPCIRWPM